MHKLACNVAPICSNCIHLSMSKSTTLLQFEAFEVCWSFVRRSFHWNGWHEVQGTSVCKEMEDGIPLPGLKVPFRTAFSQAINFALRSIRVDASSSGPTGHVKYASLQSLCPSTQTYMKVDQVLWRSKQDYCDFEILVWQSWILKFILLVSTGYCSNWSYRAFTLLGRPR